MGISQKLSSYLFYFTGPSFRYHSLIYRKSCKTSTLPLYAHFCRLQTWAMYFSSNVTKVWRRSVIFIPPPMILSVTGQVRVIASRIFSVSTCHVTISPYLAKIRHAFGVQNPWFPYGQQDKRYTTLNSISIVRIFQRSSWVSTRTVIKMWSDQFFRFTGRVTSSQREITEKSKAQWWVYPKNAVLF